jgi:hypothetical protein
MLASYAGHAPLVHSLLTKHNANPNKLNDRGQSPLAGAVFKGEDEVVRVLVRGGADPRLRRPASMCGWASVSVKRRGRGEMMCAVSDVPVRVSPVLWMPSPALSTSLCRNAAISYRGLCSKRIKCWYWSRWSRERGERPRGMEGDGNYDISDGAWRRRRGSVD